MKYRAIVRGCGGYLPERLVTNNDLSKIVDTNDEWLQQRTGIKQRYFASDTETTTDLATFAAESALQNAGLTSADLDMIAVATTTPELTFPATAVRVQAKLGMHHGFAFDVQAVCSGFVYALTVADKFIKSGSAKNVLVIGADCLSRIIDWTDRSTCVLFGDGAGAVILQASTEPGVHATLLHANGAYANMLEVPNGVSRTGDDKFIRMQGSDVFKFAVNAMDVIVEDILNGTGMTKADIDWLVPHQANARIIAATAKKLMLSMDKVILTVPLHGNTSAASIPLALDTGVRDGRIKPGQLLLFEAIGGGFAWGAALVRY